jgi:hypothetical protein
LVINYYLQEAREGGATMTISDISGAEVATRTGPSDAGINRVLWDMRPGEDEDTGRSGFLRRMRTPPLPAGDYLITVEVGGERQSTIGTIRERIW